eukprot:547813-Rhodomonas_salina.1
MLGQYRTLRSTICSGSTPLQGAWARKRSGGECGRERGCRGKKRRRVRTSGKEGTKKVGGEEE